MSNVRNVEVRQDMLVHVFKFESTLNLHIKSITINTTIYFPILAHSYYEFMFI